MLSFPISPIGFHPSGCFPSGLHPSGCLPFGCYASNGLFLDTILFGTLPLDSILPVFSLWGVRPSLYLHLITAFYFCKMGYFTKKRPVFPTKHQWKFPPLLCYNKNVGRIAKCAQQKCPHRTHSNYNLAFLICHEETALHHGADGTFISIGKITAAFARPFYYPSATAFPIPIALQESH